MPAITTDPDVGTVLWMQLHDSAFPAGRLVHSHGLEEWLTGHPGADAVTLEATVLGYLIHGHAPFGRHDNRSRLADVRPRTVLPNSMN